MICVDPGVETLLAEVEDAEALDLLRETSRPVGHDGPLVPAAAVEDAAHRRTEVDVQVVSQIEDKEFAAGAYSKAAN